MIYYNVTLHIEADIESDWLQWMRDTHIPEVLQTGLFADARLLKIRSDQDQQGQSYAVQYTAHSQAALDQYYRDHAPGLRQKGLALFGDKMIAFRTELDILHTFTPVV